MRTQVDPRKDPRGALRDAARRNDVDGQRSAALELIGAGHPFQITGWNEYGFSSQAMPLSARALALTIWAAVHIDIDGISVPLDNKTGVEQAEAIARVAGGAINTALSEAQGIGSAAWHLKAITMDRIVDPLSHKFHNHHLISYGTQRDAIRHLDTALRNLRVNTNQWRAALACALLQITASVAASKHGPLTLDIALDHEPMMVATDAPEAMDAAWRDHVAPMLACTLMGFDLSEVTP